MNCNMNVFYDASWNGVQKLIFRTQWRPHCFVDSQSKSLTRNILVFSSLFRRVFQLTEEGEGEAAEKEKVEEEAAPEPEKAEWVMEKQNSKSFIREQL